LNHDLIVFCDKVFSRDYKSRKWPRELRNSGVNEYQSLNDLRNTLPLTMLHELTHWFDGWVKITDPSQRQRPGKMLLDCSQDTRANACQIYWIRLLYTGMAGRYGKMLAVYLIMRTRSLIGLRHSTLAGRASLHVSLSLVLRGWNQSRLIYDVSVQMALVMS
jgi:hypothetical protein